MYELPDPTTFILPMRIHGICYRGSGWCPKCDAPGPTEFYTVGPLDEINLTYWCDGEIPFHGEHKCNHKRIINREYNEKCVKIVRDWYTSQYPGVELLNWFCLDVMGQYTKYYDACTLTKPCIEE